MHAILFLRVGDDVHELVEGNKLLLAREHHRIPDTGEINAVLLMGIIARKMHADRQ